jgi:hypothetical protein
MFGRGVLLIAPFNQNYCRYRREKKRSDRARYKGRVIVEREQATDSDSRTREC